MLTYSFENSGSDSLYEYLYKCIKGDILSRTLKPDEKLPSKRSFAKNLGVSIMTVENAYEQLISEGYLYSIPKKGFYVADIKGAPVNKPIVPGGEQIPVTTDTERYLADFSSNSAGKHFPYAIWSRLLRDTLRNEQQVMQERSPTGGVLSLRQAIAIHLRNFRGMSVDPEQIIIGAGTEYLYGQLVQLLGRDKIYGVEDPGYAKMSQVYTANGAEVRYIPLDGNGIRIDELEKAQVRVAHISLSHQFPTGLITPISRRYELMSWASGGKDRYIIEDDYDSEFRMIGKPIPTMQSIDTQEKVIYLNTFSKSLSNTLRISYMVLPRHLMKLYYQKLAFYACPVTTLIQVTLARFIGEGYFEKHINRMRTYYRKQRDLLVECIADSKMSGLADISEADSGLHFLLRLDIPCSDEEFICVMEKRRVKICALSEYYHSQENRSLHKFVINYSSLSEDQIRESIALMAEAVSSLAGSGKKG